ncbi:hypothetical protein FEM48_ZijujUnG0001300 [Ziziphus jujuba var. spinosa]|uniref:Agenet domain-containing protein n=1 Tax=Ziziphus jujuba var. spinosa TaxID=714518 RepID=A0A978UA46_ZIZJJ|nr:hypothetical protein FEM48_ZijujUnG0001300 [Ziziphus jujuba var. spinosa]
MSHSQFSKGDQVEVVEDPGQSYASPYFLATVLHSSASNKSLIFVEYQSVLDTTESRSDARKRLWKFVDLENVRSIPPLELNRPFKLGDIVDAYHDNCWSRGIIMDILENSKYLVILHGNSEEIAGEQCNLRLHTDWDNRFLVPPLKTQEEVLGCSSIGYGAAVELGPLRVSANGTGLQFNEFAWNTGFSSINRFVYFPCLKLLITLL